MSKSVVEAECLRRICMLGQVPVETLKSASPAGEICLIRREGVC